MRGWGAVCGQEQTQGVWNSEEIQPRINALELIAASFAVRAFTKKSLGNPCTPKSRQYHNSSIYMYTQNGRDSVPSTGESHTTDLGLLSVQTDNYYCKSFTRSGQSESRFPIQSLSGLEQLGPEQSVFCWETDQMYVFPPFCLVGRCLAKVQKERASVVLITPTWQAQPWCPRLLQMSIADPILLPQTRDLLWSPHQERHPLAVNGTLRLAAWKISDEEQQQKDYQAMLQIWSGKPGDLYPGCLQQRLE